MLQRSAWLLETWQWTWQPIPLHDPQKPVRIRNVLDSSSGNRLGFLHWNGTPPAASYWWNPSPHIDAYETDDVSHLFTLQRSWWRRSRWLLSDAEGEPVGKLAASNVYDPLGRFLARIERGADVTLVSSDGLELATWKRERRGDRIELRNTGSADPFWNMLVLSAVAAFDGDRSSS